MTKDEHELMMAMFTRVYELIGQMRETLRSNDLWRGDDETAFSELARSKISLYSALACDEYRRVAKTLGVLPDEPDPQLPPNLRSRT